MYYFIVDSDSIPDNTKEQLAQQGLTVNTLEYKPIYVRGRPASVVSFTVNEEGLRSKMVKYFPPNTNFSNLTINPLDVITIKDKDNHTIHVLSGIANKEIEAYRQENMYKLTDYLDLPLNVLRYYRMDY
jgi:hypothetical protein